MNSFLMRSRSADCFTAKEDEETHRERICEAGTESEWWVVPLSLVFQYPLPLSRYLVRGPGDVPPMVRVAHLFRSSQLRFRAE